MNVAPGSVSSSPVVYILGSVACTSVLALSIDQSVRGADSLLFAGIMLGTSAMGACVWLMRREPTLDIRKYVSAKELFNGMKTWRLLIVAVAAFEYVLYVESAQKIEIAVTTIIADLGPIFFILTLALEDRLSTIEPTSKKLRPDSYLMFSFAFLGVLLAVVSISNGFHGLDSDSIRGVMLAGGSAILGGCTAFTRRWARDLRNRVTGVDVQEGSKDDLPFAMVGYAATRAIAALVCVAISLSIHHEFDIDGLGILLAVGIGIVPVFLGDILWRTASVLTERIGAAQLIYLSPAASLVLLVWLTEVRVDRLDYLVFGTSIVIASSLLLELNPESVEDRQALYGFKALVIATWAYGFMVYLRDAEAGISIPVWKSSDYWAILALASTTFVLILSFRISRITQRTRMEEQLMTSLLRRLQLAARDGIFDHGSDDSQDAATTEDRPQIENSIIQDMITIRTAFSPKQLNGSYMNLRNRFRIAWKRKDLDFDNRQALASLEADLDLVTYSRQHGQEFGELSAIVVFGVVTMALSILVDPGLTGWPGAISDMVLVLFGATIAFLIVNLRDLRLQRTTRIFEVERGTKPPDYAVQLDVNNGLRLARIAALVLGVAVVALVGLLLVIRFKNPTILGL